MSTLFRNNLSGTLSATAAIGATSLSSAGFANLPVVSSPDVMWLTLDPEGTAGAPEIVQVTAHTASATTVTVVRAQQGTTAREHLSTVAWVHALTRTDIDDFVVSATLDDYDTSTEVDTKVAAEASARSAADAAILSGASAFTGNADLGSNKVTNLATPTASTDGATKGYVDTEIAAIPDQAYTWATGSSSLWSLASGTVTATSPASYIRYSTTPTGGMWINFYLEISSLSGTGNLRLDIPASYTVPRQSSFVCDFFDNSLGDNWHATAIARTAGYIEFYFINGSGTAALLSNSNLAAGDQVYGAIFIPEATAP